MADEIDHDQLNRDVAKAIEAGEKPLTKAILLEWLDANDPARNLSLPSARRTTAARRAEAKALYLQAREKAIGSGLATPTPAGDAEHDLLTLRQWCGTDEPPRQPAKIAINEPEQMVSLTIIVSRFELTPHQKDRLRKQLAKWRCPANCTEWAEIQDRKPRQDKFLYRLGSVQHLIDAAKSR